MIAYFQRTGSCSVCVRAFRQWRSKLFSARVDRVPASSNRRLVASMAISVDSTLASATASPDRNPVICAPLMRLTNYMSFGCGLAGNGHWDYVLPNEIESTCAMAIKLCGQFFEALPALLKGLEYDVVELDDSNPRANQ